MKKKILSLLLCMILLACLTGCGDQNEAKDEDISSDEIPVEVDERLISQFIGEWTGKSSTDSDVKWQFKEGGEAIYLEYIDVLSEWTYTPSNYEVIDEDTIHIQIHNLYNHVGEFHYELNGNELKINYVKTLDVSDEEQKNTGFKSYTLTKSETEG